MKLSPHFRGHFATFGDGARVAHPGLKDSSQWTWVLIPLIDIRHIFTSPYRLSLQVAMATITEKVLLLRDSLG
jgi:hypothetical protein